jgi:hypothetical protein
MKTDWESLFGLFDRQEREREVEEELNLHLELMAQDLRQRQFSSAEARRLALERFGDVEKVRRECVEVRKRNRPLVRVLKSFLILLFFAGFLFRISSANINVRHIGDILMIIGIMGRLFVHLRGLTHSNSSSKYDQPSLLTLTRVVTPSSVNHNERSLTPVERVIFDK